MLLNIFTIFYFLIRMAPFIVVSYFTIQLLFTQDISGFIYLIGLVITCIINIQLGNYPSLRIRNGKSMAKYCKIIDLTDNGPLSDLPLGQAVLGYTMFFTLYIILKNGLVQQNIGFIVIITLLVAGDLLWNITNMCADVGGLVTALFVGGSFGVLWALLIDTTKKRTKIDLTRFNNLNPNPNPMCNLNVISNNKQIYSCTTSNIAM